MKPKSSRIYDARMPRVTQAFHNAQNASMTNWRPLTMAGANRVEPGTMWNVPIRISRTPPPTCS